MTQKILAKLMSFAGSNKLGLFKIAIASSFLVIVPQGQVKAALLTVANNSFEAPIITAQSGSVVATGLVGGWTFAGGAQGFFNPSLGETFSPGFGYGPSPVLPNGNQVAYSNGGTLAQQLSAVLQPNTRYTLSAYIGRRKVLAFPNNSIILLAGTTVLASSNSVTPDPGTFLPVTVNYTSGSIGDPLIGQPLAIYLSSFDVQTNFDMITLDASPIPEPSAILGLLGFGLLGIVSTLKQKR